MMQQDAKVIFLSDDKPTICQKFVSLEGEGEAIGELSIYIRLSHCNARCKFCDTKFSWNYDAKAPSANNKTLKTELQREINNKEINRLTITGGEPLIYLRHFNNIFDEINEAAGGKLKHLGIESNGIIMSNVDYNIELLEQFNRLKKKGVQCTLTISPKIDYNTSWHHVEFWNQKRLDRVYYRVLKNTSILLSAHNVNYKFIYDFTGEIIEWRHTKKFIDYLIDDLNVPLRNILLMPLTPDDPINRDAYFWQESKKATALKCMELGLRMSPRLHVDLELD